MPHANFSSSFRESKSKSSSLTFSLSLCLPVISFRLCLLMSIGSSAISYAFNLSIILLDCSNEDNVKFGENFKIALAGVTAPISVEFRPIAVEANQTSRPALVLMNQEEYQAGYENRISVTESEVTLQSVIGADEGSYTILDADGKIQKKVCLNVKGEDGVKNSFHL